MKACSGVTGLATASPSGLVGSFSSSFFTGSLSGVIGLSLRVECGTGGGGGIGGGGGGGGVIGVSGLWAPGGGTCWGTCDAKWSPGRGGCDYVSKQVILHVCVNAMQKPSRGDVWWLSCFSKTLIETSAEFDLAHHVFTNIMGDIWYYLVLVKPRLNCPPTWDLAHHVFCITMKKDIK